MNTLYAKAIQSCFNYTAPDTPDTPDTPDVSGVSGACLRPHVAPKEPMYDSGDNILGHLNAALRKDIK